RVGEQTSEDRRGQLGATGAGPEVGLLGAVVLHEDHQPRGSGRRRWRRLGAQPARDGQGQRADRQGSQERASPEGHGEALSNVLWVKAELSTMASSKSVTRASGEEAAVSQPRSSFAASTWPSA